eukprot:TRINITY_DN4103_c0_g1_i3.p1 TRINITY_DN4103_c0_g1~~TRINITY_DN4103_c0_g1_i3.p1  ORF type:complete len:138 (+),score=45.87 TRINITY_DN4103_c0_g1_i3:54-467(+)
MKAFAVFFVLSVLFLGATAVNVQFTDCGSKLIKITSIEASSWPPVAGQNLTLAASGTASSSISSGTYDSIVDYIGIQVSESKGDFCTLTKCPISAGPATITSVSAFPSGLPSGDYTVQLSTASGSDAIFCIQVGFTL